LIAELPEFHSWALCEWYCAQSAAVAADNPRRAARLALLALRVARHLPGPAAWRDRLLGYVLFHLANARRVLGHLPAAAAALDRAEEVWAAGASADPGLLDPGRPLDLVASLRRAQRRLDEAVALLDQALDLAANDAAAVRLFLIRAKVLEEQGDFSAALATLDRAEARLDPEGAPHQHLALLFNRSDYLRQLGCQDEAEALVPAVRALVERLDHDLNRVRLRWLEARLAAGGGRPAAATAAYREVRDAFATRKIAYDTGLDPGAGRPPAGAGRDRRGARAGRRVGGDLPGPGGRPRALRRPSPLLPGRRARGPHPGAGARAAERLARRQRSARLTRLTLTSSGSAPTTAPRHSIRRWRAPTRRSSSTRRRKPPLGGVEVAGTRPGSPRKFG
jgi:tetratricopeptide (TPR) repeat protein